MPFGPTDIPSILPEMGLILDKKINLLVELEDHIYSRHSMGTPDDTNSLGARVTFITQVNGNYGNNSIDLGAFREGGSEQSQQLTITFTADNISGAIGGAALRNIKSPSHFGDGVEAKTARMVKYLKKQRDIDLCHGTFPLGFRAKVLSVTSGSSTAGSVVVMDSEEGSRFLEPGAVYVGCNATTGAAHGVTTGHPVISKNADNVTVTFQGDVTSGTTWGVGDILVNKGDATGVSSFNRAMYGFEYFLLDSGEYFGLSKDQTGLLRGIRENGNGNNISRSLLLRGEVRYKYRWNDSSDQKLDSMIDVVSFAQEAVYKTLGFDLLQYVNLQGGPLQKFNGAIKTVQDGNRLLLANGNVRPSNWFRYDPSQVRRYVLSPTKIWDEDGLKFRSTPVSGVGSSNGVPAMGGSILDQINWTIEGKEQMAMVIPAHGIWYYGLGYSGMFNGVY